jgi:hypothetical protein
MGMKSKLIHMMAALVVVFTAITCATPVYAQKDKQAQSHNMEYSLYPKEDTPKVRLEWGVGVGTTYSGLSQLSSDVVKLNPRLSIAGHLDMALRIGRHFAVETEICYEGGSIKASTPRANHKIRTRTMDIPVMASLRVVNNRIRISVGPQLTVMSRAEYTSGGETMFFGSFYPTWNLAAGVGVGITRHFLIEARYIHPLKSNLNSFDGVEFSTRAYRVTAGLTLLF